MEVYSGAVVLPMAPNTAAVDALAVASGRVFAVGRRDDVIGAAKQRASELGEELHVEDLGGCAIVPGFIDPHHHFTLAVFYDGCVDCTGAAAPNMKALGEKLREEAARLPKGSWVMGQGYDPAVLEERRHPTREELDAFCPDHPTLLLHYSCHEGVANSRALELAGYDEHSADPPAGEVVRGRGRRPTGRVIEMAFVLMEAMGRKSRLARDETDFAARLVGRQRTMFAAGITHVVDPLVSPELEAIYRSVKARGLFTMPLTMMMSSIHGFSVPPRDRFSEASRTGDGTEDFRVGPMKLVFDGGNRCAFCLSIPQLLGTILRVLGHTIKTGRLAALELASESKTFFSEGKARTGIRYYGKDEARAMVQDAQAQGFGVATHAMGNDAIEMVLDVYRDADVHAVGGFPPRIEHATFADVALTKRIADMGLAVVTQPDFLSIPVTRDMIIPRPFKYMPIRSMIEAGVRVSGSSDAPVLPRFDPLSAIRAAVTRKTLHGARMHPEEAIDVMQALALYTREAAYVSGCADVAGTLEPGKRADFVVLSEDPRPIDALARVAVRRTVVAGTTVFSDVRAPCIRE